MRDDHAERLERLKRDVLTSPARLTPEVRTALSTEAEANGVPPALARLRGQIVAGAADISADDVKATLAAGHTEDEVFEAVVAASLGAGLRRLERALAALDEARR